MPLVQVHAFFIAVVLIIICNHSYIRKKSYQFMSDTFLNPTLCYPPFVCQIQLHFGSGNSSIPPPEKPGFFHAIHFTIKK